MAKMPKDFRPLHVQMLAAGATVRTTGTGHRKYTLPSGVSDVMPTSPSDWRALVQCRAQVRRALREPTDPPGRTA
jgi:hypothetical protein